MIPEWMEKKEEYIPPRGGNAFIFKSIQTMGKIMSRIQVQRGHEKGRPLPPLFKLFLTFGGILLISIAQSRLILMAYAACILVYLCTWPAKDIAKILRSSIAAAAITALILLPAVIVKPSLAVNEIIIIVKVFFSVLTISIFNHTTQWNHITGALRRIHVPGLFVFIIDITLKYIVQLGTLILDLLTSLKLRAVGKNNKKYTSVGGVMGVTFIRGAQMNREMYEAMQCRGFTDDYKGV